MTRLKNIWLAALAAMALMVIADMAAPGYLDAEPFYKGKTIRIISFAGPGGSYDIHARVLARHITGHIAGNPRVVVQNMPGGGGVVAANYVYKVVAADPTVVLGPHADAYIAQLAGVGAVEYDVARFNWIGSTSTDRRILMMRADTPYTTMEALLRAEPKEVALAVTGPGAGAHAFARLYEHVFNIEFRRLIYRHGPEMFVAAERGEAHGLPGSLDAALVTHGDWLKTGFLRIILQGGEERDKRIPDVPTIYEVAPPEHHNLIRLMEGSGAWNKPFATGPQVSREHVQILREAFMETVRDPRYIDEARRAGLSIDPMNPEALQARMREAVRQPEELVEILKSLYK
jgi:tripartite-type tricarboxylate transporter receptor subunit TctC